MDATDTTGLEIKRVPLDSLHVDPANVRTHGERNMGAIEASLRRFGQAEPLVVHAKTGRVIGGNGRLVAMKRLGWAECDVVQLDVDDITATALGIALNRTAELAGWDEAGLARLLSELQEEDALEGVGFDEDSIEELLAGLEEAGGAEIEDPGPQAPPEKPVSRDGDSWILGKHRLLCGDSTNPDDVARVMNGEPASLVATDPPYLVDYTGERPNDSGKDWTANYREIDIEDAEGFFRAVFTNVLSVLAPHAAVYCWHAHKRCGLIQRIWAELGILDHQQIVWVKPTAVFGRAYWHFRHEPCLMGWRTGSKPRHDGANEQDSVWELDYDGRARASSDHPTQKPVEIFERPILKHTRPGAVCFEPFSGSGSQLIAAEKTARKCRAIEISPAFVDVAIRRWETATGGTAVLESTGQLFEVVEKERRNDE